VGKEKKGKMLADFGFAVPEVEKFDEKKQLSGIPFRSRGQTFFILSRQLSIILPGKAKWS
jgi:hypothetical protein